MSRDLSLKPRFWGFVALVMALVFGGVFISQSAYMGRQQERIAALEQRKAALVTENQSLTQQIEYTKTDEYIEREARQKLGLVKPGEVLYESSDPD